MCALSSEHRPVPVTKVVSLDDARTSFDAALLHQVLRPVSFAISAFLRPVGAFQVLTPLVVPRPLLCAVLSAVSARLLQRGTVFVLAHADVVTSVLSTESGLPSGRGASLVRAHLVLAAVPSTQPSRRRGVRATITAAQLGLSSVPYAHAIPSAVVCATDHRALLEDPSVLCCIRTVLVQHWVTVTGGDTGTSCGMHLFRHGALFSLLGRVMALASALSTVSVAPNISHGVRTI